MPPTEIKIDHAVAFAKAFHALEKAKAARRAAEDQYQKALNEYDIAKRSLMTGLDPCEILITDRERRQCARP